MGLMPFSVRITRSSVNLKYKAPGFDILQKPNENVLLALFFMILFALCSVEGDISKNMKLFSKAIFCELKDLSNLPFALIILDLMGQPVCFSFLCV